MNKLSLLFIFCSLLFPMVLLAHGDLDGRIMDVSEEIKISKDSAYLYFKRGRLYFQHEAYKKSISDLKKSSKLGYNSIEQELIFSKNYFRLEQYNKSLSFSSIILNRDPFHALTIKLQAQTYLKLTNFHDAAIGFEKVIEYTTQAFPENYIDASVAWEALDTKAGYENASNIIKKGIADLGELMSLFVRLIAIQTNQEDFVSAIDSQKRVLDLSHRKERAYYKLCELYILNDNNNLAFESLNLAKLHFEKLPLRIQNTSFMKQLLSDIKIKETLLQPNN